MLRLIRILIHNGLSVLATWLTFILCVNMAVLIIYEDSFFFFPAIQRGKYLKSIELYLLFFCNSTFALFFFFLIFILRLLVLWKSLTWFEFKFPLKLLLDECHTLGFQNHFKTAIFCSFVNRVDIIDITVYLKHEIKI